jgi:hypothetical protein
MSKMISKPMVRLAQMVDLSCTDSDTISKRTKTRFHMTHAPSSSIGCMQNDSEPIVHSAQTVHLFCVNISTISKRIEMSLLLTLITLKYHRLCPKHFLRMDHNEIPHDPHHHGVPSGASKIVSEPMVSSAQTVLLSCVKISTISKWTKTNFHLSLIT